MGRSEERHDGKLLVERIQDRIGDLTEPSTIVVEQWVVDAAAGRMVPRSRRVTFPGLVVQLERPPVGSTEGQFSPGASSRPPGNLAGLSTLQTISSESRIWARRMLPMSKRPSSLMTRLERLAVAAGTLQLDQLRTLDEDVLRWWAAARITTTWADPPLRPHVPCMVCGHRGGLQVTLYPMAAICRECDSAWDASTIGILGSHIKLMTEAQPDVEAVCDGPILVEAIPAEVPGVLSGVGPDAPVIPGRVRAAHDQV